MLSTGFRVLMTGRGLYIAHTGRTGMSDSQEGFDLEFRYQAQNTEQLSCRSFKSVKHLGFLFKLEISSLLHLVYPHIASMKTFTHIFISFNCILSLIALITLLVLG